MVALTAQNSGELDGSSFVVLAHLWFHDNLHLRCYHRWSAAPSAYQFSWSTSSLVLILAWWHVIPLQPGSLRWLAETGPRHESATHGIANSPNTAYPFSSRQKATLHLYSLYANETKWHDTKCAKKRTIDERKMNRRKTNDSSHETEPNGKSFLTRTVISLAKHHGQHLACGVGMYRYAS